MRKLQNKGFLTLSFLQNFAGEDNVMKLLF